MRDTPPQLKLQNQVCHSLYSATNALVRAYRPLLKDLDLTYPQYLVMLCLWEEDNVTVKAISQATRFDAGTLTPILKRLEAKDLLLRERSKQDERQRVIRLTESGEALREQARTVPNSLICLIDMTLEEAHLLKKLSEKLYAQLVD